MATVAVVLALLVLAVVAVLTVLLSREDADATGNTAAVGAIVVLFLVVVCGLAAWAWLAGTVPGSG